MDKQMTITKMKKMKQDQIPISIITAYDYPSAQLASEAGVDAILVGDSLGNVVLGYETTIPVTIEDMIYHSRAVARGSKGPLVITDMPFMTYHGSLDLTMRNAARIMQEGYAQAVKLEGGEEIAPAVAALVKAGIPVMGHIGLTPQSINQIGGYKVQGKDELQLSQLVEQARRIEQAGAFAIVLELVTNEAAAKITEQLSIPTIGIGAGESCDGQVLVFHDLLQYSANPQPKRFVKTYANIGEQVRSGIAAYVKEVKERQFPEPAHSFNQDAKPLAKLYGTGTRR